MNIHQEPSHPGAADIAEGGSPARTVGTILLDHHLSNISEENDRLRERNAKLAIVRDILTTVKISIDTEDDPDEKNIATVNLFNGIIAQSVHKLSAEELRGRGLMFSLPGAKPIPLRKIVCINVEQGNQSIGSVCGIEDIFVDEEGIRTSVMLWNHDPGGGSWP